MVDFDGERYGDMEFVENSDPRCPVVLILDCSGSMAGEPMQALQAGLDTLVSELHKDPLAARRCEVSIVAYGAEVAQATPFATVDNLVVPQLEIMGTTATGAAVTEAIRALDERKQEYRNNGINFYRPWVMLISDGLATDDITEACRLVKEKEASKSLAFFAIGVEGADMDELSQYSSRGAMSLNGLKFDELFVWLSASQSAVSSSQVGDRVSLPSPESWAEI